METLVHDHETALYHFGTAHVECNVHILRYLTKNSEYTGTMVGIHETVAERREQNAQAKDG